jgi:ABC-type phosphate/phosphonate transport system substrate-binding protein
LWSNLKKPRILVGAVVYDPKVERVWEIIKEFFAQSNYSIGMVFYDTYELMVEALLAGDIQIAWNDSLAWVDVTRRTEGKCRPIAMRDTDRDRRTHIIVRKQAGFQRLSDLRGKVFASGSKDSPQACLLPLHLLRQNGLVASRDFTLLRFDVMLGKHGDHVGGELDALKSVQRGESDACAVLDLNWARWQTDGTIDPTALTSLATTGSFDHCNFTVLGKFSAQEEKTWTDVLFSMSYDNPRHREMMDLEGLKKWLPGRTTGYTALSEAVREQKFFEK